MYFRVVVACGHIGCRREVEVTRYFEADSAIDAWESALMMPRVKKSQRSRAIRRVEQIDVMEYLWGKLAERENPYLQNKRVKADQII
ncbi:MAG TPA: hypothetical protein GX404_05300 [Syntrophomonadaceae bacterium]|nr:hypothetical protein [Syntrophomonadaceae bacterium]